MKKLLSCLALAISVLAGCNQRADQPTTTSNGSLTEKAVNSDVLMSGKVAKKTLNNVDSADAEAWISNYKKARVVPGMTVENVSYFLNRRMVEKILAYMAKEGSNVDGIRFYLAKKSLSDAEIMLLLVSTKKGATADKHTNYYEHDALLYDTARLVTPRVNKKGTDPGAVLYDKCPDCPDIEKGCKLAKGGLPRSYAEKMIQGFDGKNMNTDAVWLSIEIFKKMALEKNFNGIRVYFGTYPDGTYTPPKEPSYAGRNTIVLTYVDRNGIDDFSCYLLASNSQISAKGIDDPAAGPPQNNGSLCPNNCD